MPTEQGVEEGRGGGPRTTDVDEPIGVVGGSPQVLGFSWSCNLERDQPALSAPMIVLFIPFLPCLLSCPELPSVE